MTDEPYDLQDAAVGAAGLLTLIGDQAAGRLRQVSPGVRRPVPAQGPAGISPSPPPFPARTPTARPHPPRGPVARTPPPPGDRPRHTPLPLLGEHSRPPLVLVAHGSRDPRALATAVALAARIRDLRPALTVRLGHLEPTGPLLADTLAALPAGRAVLVPLLLSRGHHTTRDLPAAAAAAPHLTCHVAAPLGPHPLLVDALHDRLTEAGWSERGRHRGVVLAAAGSRDPRGAVDTRCAATLLARRLGVPVVPAYATTGPDVATAVRTLAALGRHRSALASYFTAPGRFATDCAAAAARPAAAPLGDHPALARLALHRYDEARTTAPRPAPRQPAPA